MNYANMFGKYRRLVQAGIVYTGVGLAQTIVADGAAAYAGGLVLSNPKGNTGKNFSLLGVGIGQQVVGPAVSALGLAQGFNTTTDVIHTTPASVFRALVDTNSADTTNTGKLDTVATLPSQGLVSRILGETLTGAVTLAPSMFEWFDMNGSMELTPGAFVCMWSKVVGPTNGYNLSFMWAELASAGV